MCRRFWHIPKIYENIVRKIYLVCNSTLGAISPSFVWIACSIILKDTWHWLHFSARGICPVAGAFTYVPFFEHGYWSPPFANRLVPSRNTKRIDTHEQVLTLVTATKITRTQTLHLNTHIFLECILVVVLQ